MPRTRPPYPEEFKREAIKLVGISSKSQHQIAEDLGISDVTLRNWVKQAERDEGKRPDGLSSDEREELARLRRENQTLRMEREILKKAAAFFGSPLRLGVTRAGQSPECPAPSRVLGDSSDLEGCAPLERLLPCPFRPPSMAGGRRPLAATSLHHKHRGGSTGEADRKPPCSGGTNRRVPTHVAVEPRASCAGPRCQARATRPASGATAGVVSAASHPQMTRSPLFSPGRPASRRRDLLADRGGEGELSGLRDVQSAGREPHQLS